MSFITIATSLTGEVPGTPRSLAQSRTQDALGKIFDSSDWSFQTAYAGWLTPGIVANQGTYTTTPYQNTVIADATGTAVLAALSGPPLLTTLQYRDPARAIYNIVGYDTTTNAPFATLTLDRPWMEPTSGPGQPYMIYQCYFVAPVQDFRHFIEVRDTTDAGRLNYWSLSQADLARRDPQRTKFADPAYVVSVGTDQRPGSSTPGWMMFELWPQQLARVPYSFSYKRRGPMMVAPSDTVPYPITEELVEWKAKEILYQYKAAMAEEKSKGAGAGWMVLSGEAKKEYDERFSFILPIDINLRSDNIDRVGMCDDRWWGGRPYSNDLGGLNVGSYPE
jgi:hypothetical protein